MPFIGYFIIFATVRNNTDHSFILVLYHIYNQRINLLWLHLEKKWSNLIFLTFGSTCKAIKSVAFVSLNKSFFRTCIIYILNFKWYEAIDFWIKWNLLLKEALNKCFLKKITYQKICGITTAQVSIHFCLMKSSRS